MASKVTEEHVITTQEGTKLTVKPLTIRALRKFMDVIDKLNQLQEGQGREFRHFQRHVEKYNKQLERWLEDETGDVAEPTEPVAPKQNEFDSVDIMIEAAKIALEKYNAEFVADEDALEDELDIHTLRQILKDAGGVDLGDDDPNPTAPTKGA